MAKKRVLGVVGMGHVGAHVAYALAIQGIADELVLVDQNEQKLASEVQDLRDAVAVHAPPRDGARRRLLRPWRVRRHRQQRRQDRPAARHA
ncbi:MAG: lactate/malate family dehydrogenase [Oscillibacter sp.]